MIGRKFTRRSVLKASLAAAGAGLVAPLSGLSAASRKRHIAVVGAGAFGGWTALYLLRSGTHVTLLDAWGPGNSRASSGDETRVIRGIYGNRGIYTAMAVRALTLWSEHEKRWKRKLYTQTGALWIVIGNAEFEKASLPEMRKNNLPYQEWTPEEAAKRYPQINFEEVNTVVYEERAGYLLARQSCAIVVENFISEGGEYRQSAVNPGQIVNGNLQSIVLSDGSSLKADQYVFACGPWLPKIFPEILQSRITPTRQEVFYFGTPPGDLRFTEKQLPVWINHDRVLFYGIPGNQYRGFKIADDTHGPPFDPTTGERIVSEQALKAARQIMELRFPDMKGAPLVESRVCQYENTPDSHFILDRHPDAENVWILGGGSGHGFKFGPALGELAAAVITTQKQPPPEFLLSRLKNE